VLADGQAKLARCEVRFPVARRCISRAMSPDEPYLLADPRGLELIFRVAVGSEQSWLRSDEDAHVIDDKALGARLREDIIQHDAFFVACDRLPPDGPYYVDLCFSGVPASACADTVPATGVGIFELARTDGSPIVTMLQRARAGRVLVSFSADLDDPRCDR
jgi:hypothetical protein